MHVGTSYPFAQMAKALATANTHPDAAVREAAESKAAKWRKVIAGMADNLLDIGSRTPVQDMPAWVTPEVVHGGFTTGSPLASGPLQVYELALAKRLGLLPADGTGDGSVAGANVARVRLALFAHHLTEAGVAELSALLDAGTYHVAVPEEAALLVAVALIRRGAESDALDLVRTISPWADRLRFTPAPTNGTVSPAPTVPPAPTVAPAPARGVAEPTQASGGVGPVPAGGTAESVLAGGVVEPVPAAGAAESVVAGGVVEPVPAGGAAESVPAAGAAESVPAGGAVESVVDGAVPEGDVVFRMTAGQAREVLLARQPDARIEAQREALAVWNPFADELLSLWLETIVDGGVGAVLPDGWTERAAVKLVEYEALAQQYTRNTRHRKNHSNLQVMRAALVARLAGMPVETHLLRRAVDGMLARRGRPGSASHTALRAWQATEAAAPSRHALAQVVAGRLAELRPDDGIADPDRLLGEALGRALPPAVVRVVERAAAGTPEALVDRGVIGSAEVLATLTPQLTAGVVAGAYPDPAVRRLMAANYRAFRGRRSLLLLNLAHQVRVEELPWVAAAGRLRDDGTGTDAVREAARATLTRLAALVVRGFPATALPNPMIRELSTLSKAAGLDVAWTEELAADIFMGTFSKKFPVAAKAAGELLGGTLYAQYYGIDYAALTGPARQAGPARVVDFGRLCRERAGQTDDERYRRPAANGTIIEQAQILTTHNLATLISLSPPGAGHLDLARRCLRTAQTLVSRLEGNRRPLAAVKDAAYAWRQMLVHLSMVSTETQAAFVAEARASAPRRLVPAVDGLAEVLRGGTARPFLGWTVGRHWILQL